MRGPDLPHSEHPQPAALEKRFRCLGPGLNRAETATLWEVGGGGTPLYFRTTYGNKGGVLTLPL